MYKSVAYETARDERALNDWFPRYWRASGESSRNYEGLQLSHLVQLYPALDWVYHYGPNVHKIEPNMRMLMHHAEHSKPFKLLRDLEKLEKHYQLAFYGHDASLEQELTYRVYDRALLWQKNLFIEEAIDQVSSAILKLAAEREEVPTTFLRPSLVQYFLITTIMADALDTYRMPQSQKLSHEYAEFCIKWDMLY
jgi:hypothetical protein